MEDAARTRIFADELPVIGVRITVLAHPRGSGEKFGKHLHVKERNLGSNKDSLSFEVNTIQQQRLASASR